MSEQRFRSVNQSLGDTPRIGPLPADQVIPWTAILMSTYYGCKLILNMSWVWTGAIAAWGCSTWWVLTGSKAWRFLSKFVGVPNWTRGYALYKSFVDVPSVEEGTEKSSQRRSK